MFWICCEVEQASGRKDLLIVQGKRKRLFFYVGVSREMAERIAKRQGARARLCDRP